MMPPFKVTNCFPGSRDLSGVGGKNAQSGGLSDRTGSHAQNFFPSSKLLNSFLEIKQFKRRHRNFPLEIKGGSHRWLSARRIYFLRGGGPSRRKLSRNWVGGVEWDLKLRGTDERTNE
jgi:hypothetical protein